MKRFSMLLLAGCLSVFALAQAQEAQDTQVPPPSASARDHHMPTVDEMLAHMTQKLNLSQEQQASVRSILQNQHDQMEQLMQDTSSSHEARHAKMKEMHESTHTQIRALLNDDQKKQFDEFAQEHERHMRGHGESHGQGQGEGQENGAPPPPPI